VPLTSVAVDLFERLKRMAGRSPWVFPAEAGDSPMDPKLMTRSVARHLDSFAKHKVDAFTAHDLRRTVRTGLARLGVRPDIAERCLNHAQPGIVATYDVHQYLDEKRDALNKWAAHLESLCEKTQ
jgi:integrase